MEKIGKSANTLFFDIPYVADMAEKPSHCLREWREFRQLTQDELADAVGTSKSVISDMERGKLRLSDKWLRRFAPALQTQPGHIIDHDPEQMDSDIIEIWAAIDERDRAQAALVLRSFIKRSGTAA